MSSKIFKSSYMSDSSRLEIEASIASTSFHITHCTVVGEKSFMFDNTTAPALALAILEAAGVVPVQRDYDSYDDGTPAHLQSVAYFLKQHNEAQERVTAEAKDKAELEAEALGLMNGYRASMGDSSAESFAGYSPMRKNGWLAVARRAREMRAEK